MYDLCGNTAFAAVSKSGVDTHNETWGMPGDVLVSDGVFAASFCGSRSCPRVLGSIGPKTAD